MDYMLTLGHVCIATHKKRPTCFHVVVGRSCSREDEAGSMNPTTLVRRRSTLSSNGRSCLLCYCTRVTVKDTIVNNMKTSIYYATCQAVYHASARNLTTRRSCLVAEVRQGPTLADSQDPRVLLFVKCIHAASMSIVKVACECLRSMRIL